MGDASASPYSSLRTRLSQNVGTATETPGGRGVSRRLAVGSWRRGPLINWLRARARHRAATPAEHLACSSAQKLADKKPRAEVLGNSSFRPKWTGIPRARLLGTMAADRAHVAHRQKRPAALARHRRRRSLSPLPATHGWPHLQLRRLIFASWALGARAYPANRVAHGCARSSARPCFGRAGW